MEEAETLIFKSKDYRNELYGEIAAWLDDVPPDNVWLGTSVEDQLRAEQRIPALLAIPARIRFLSCEPLLGPVELVCEVTGDALISNDEGAFVDWVIAGGESGPHARPMHPQWPRSLRDQCAALHHPIPFFFKQWGEWAPGEVFIGEPTGWKEDATWFNEEWVFDQIHWGDPEHKWGEDYPDLIRMGKKAASRHLDGVLHDAFPAPLSAS